jgi:hypothetical protein
MFAGVDALEHGRSLANEPGRSKFADARVRFGRHVGQRGHRGAGEQQPQAEGDTRCPATGHGTVNFAIWVAGMIDGLLLG